MIRGLWGWKNYFQENDHMAKISLQTSIPINIPMIFLTEMGEGTELLKFTGKRKRA